MPPLLLGIGAGLTGALLLVPATGSALGDLASARAERRALRAEAAAPATLQPLLAPGLALRAGDAAAARRLAAAHVQTLAKAGGLLVEDSGALPAPAGVVALRLRVSGAEKAVLGFADALDREKPVLRLRSWQIEALPGGSVRLSGELVGGWR
jgi:hypothetical protein